MISYIFLVTTVLTTTVTAATVPVSLSLPANAAPPVLSAFLSYSLELAFFPDYAGLYLKGREFPILQLTNTGNSTNPNTFSNNLLNNLGNFTGTKPNLRVGGNTQDYAIYNSSLETATLGIIDPAKSPDYPTTLHIGPSFFDSYSTFPDTKFSHGFNLGLGGNISHPEGWETLIATIPLACKALSSSGSGSSESKFFAWEYGNEPDLYSTSAQGPVRLPSWNESLYVEQWMNGTRAIKEGVKNACPELEGVEFMAPSFAGTGNHLNPLKTWEDGLDDRRDIDFISSHNYIGGATSPGVTLQHTLMNHTSTITSISNQLNASTSITTFLTNTTNLTTATIPPYILGETNSLFNEGAPGLSNAFGATLWGIDFALYCASVGIRRVHFHQGTNFRYASWQPVETNITTVGTKAPYYGNVVTAAMVEPRSGAGNASSNSNVQIVGLPLSEDTESAYAAYVGGKLARIAVVSMREYNYTVNGTSSILNPVSRPSRNYTFGVGNFSGDVSVRTLFANGSDAVSGITFDAVSYNWELDLGKPVVLGNVTRGVTVGAENGVVEVEVLDSSAVVLDFGR